MAITELKTFSISKPVIEKLDRYHKETMVPKSKLVSRLLDEFLEKYYKGEKK